MKIHNMLSYLRLSVAGLLFFSCVKGYEPEPTPVYPIKDFEGQWKGSLPYSSSGPVSEIKISLAAFNKNTNLTGYMSTPDGLMIIDGQQFFNGMYLFKIRKNNNCSNWDVSGSSYLLTTNSMGITFGGTFCEEHPRTIEGSMSRMNPVPDTTILLTMGLVGHQLKYEITDNSGIPYVVTTEIENDLGNGVWREKTSLTLENTSSDSIRYLYITPVEWGEFPNDDSLYLDRLISYSIDARPGTTYYNVTPDDSVITRVLSLGTQVTVPAGTFKCIRMTKKYIALSQAGRSGTFETWFNNNYGTIKTVQYLGDSIIIRQELIEKNW